MQADDLDLRPPRAARLGFAFAIVLLHLAALYGLMRAFAPPARLGIHYEPAGIARAIERLGAQAARRIFLFAETFEAEALLRLGFIDELVPPEALEERVEAIARGVAGLAPLAVRGMKRTIRELVRGELDAAAARDRIRTAFASEDHAEGLRAQREKRPPVFTGR